MYTFIGLVYRSSFNKLNSPVVLPYKNLIPIDRQKSKAIYLQMVDALVQLIQQRKLVANTRLPGARALAKMLAIHRNTVTVAYEELEAQGWVEIIPQKGTFVHAKIPVLKGQGLGKSKEPKQGKIGYSVAAVSFVEAISTEESYSLALDDGVPDIRLAPLAALGRAYRAVIQRSSFRKSLGYGSTLGDDQLRLELLNYLQNTRGIDMSLEQILISRGSVMGIYMVAKTLLQVNDIVVVGRSNYYTANMIFQQLGADLRLIDVDDCGIVIDELEQLCKTTKIRAIYVASHHHHPTTVTLTMDRRLQLLDLAERHHFAIIEDDYDYDFHYQRNPILPLASIDKLRHVIYIGSLSKMLAPAFRVGFVVAHPDMIHQMGRLRRIVDRQGDFPLERAIANLFQMGELQRHIRKSLRIYEQRRDQLCRLLSQELEEWVDYQKPKGGLAIWAKFNPTVDLEKTAQKALQQGLFFSAGKKYTTNIPSLQATRLGFASSTLQELEEAVTILKKVITLKKY